MKELYTTAGIFVVLILLGVWMVQNNRNEQEKKLVQLRKKWGKKQEKRTAREKKEKLEACLRRKAGESFCVDAITWNDLDLDAVFDTVDHTVSVCGEEYLYTALRMPVTTTEIREERERLMKLFAENQKAREAVQKALLLMVSEASGRTGKTTPSDYKKMQNTCEYERIAGRCSKHDFCILSHVLSAGSDRVFFGCFRSEIV